jgi:tRNA threonylcarbamoyladenosine biosynthesis protein TsaB
MIVLAVDSSTPTAAAALWRDGALLASFRTSAGNTHSECLLPMIEHALGTCGVNVADVDLFACGVGPGSFTGVRIAVSTVKGLAAPYDKPCVGISSLEGAASSCGYANGVVVPAFNARRGNVYCAAFSAKNGTISRLTEDAIISVEELCGQLSGYKERVLFVGDAAGECVSAAKDAGLDVCPTPDQALLIDAAGMCALAAGTYSAANEEEKSAFTADSLLPLYLRPGRAANAALPE